MDNASSNRSAFPAWAWVAALALALVTAYLVRRMGTQTAQLADLQHQIRRAEIQNQALQTQLDIGRQISAIMLSPESKLVKLDPNQPKLPAMLIYLHPQMGYAIVADGMPAVPSSRTLQIWFTPKTGSLTSVAIFRPNAQGLVSVLAPAN